MAVTVGDYKEIHTRGWFNTLSETADKTAVFTQGLWHGFTGAVPGLIRTIGFKTDIKDPVIMRTNVEGNIRFNAGVN